MFGKRTDDRPPLEKALEAAAGLKPGSWTSVEALALLAVEAAGRPEAHTLHDQAVEASHGLAPGSWDSVRALAVLARADRELRALGQ